jgi:hypothetical protein
VFGGTIPRSRDGVHATGRIRETSGLSKRVFLPFIRGVRSARSRSRATSARVRSMGSVSPTPTRNGGSVVRPVDFVRSVGRRDAYTRCATGRSDRIHDDGSRVDPVRPRRLSPSVFVARARSRPGRDAHVDALDDERHTRADARARRTRGESGFGRVGSVWRFTIRECTPPPLKSWWEIWSVWMDLMDGLETNLVVVIFD